MILPVGCPPAEGRRHLGAERLLAEIPGKQHDIAWTLRLADPSGSVAFRDNYARAPF